MCVLCVHVRACVVGMYECACVCAYVCVCACVRACVRACMYNVHMQVCHQSFVCNTSEIQVTKCSHDGSSPLTINIM